jgi:hypothetical protein
MIRASDLSSAAAWSRLASVSQRVDARDASNWFDGGAAEFDARISGDLKPASRGLSVEQHANLILAHLRDAV